jgi:addiction module HigA family antidote
MTENFGDLRALGMIDEATYKRTLRDLNREAGKQMHDSAHPGEVIRAICLEPLGLSVTAAAKGLSVTRKVLSDLLNGHSGVSAEMAIRLEKAFGSTAETWLRMQMQYDLWHAEQRAGKIKVTRFVVPNADTIEAMTESRKGGLPRFKSVEALLADLKAED